MAVGLTFSINLNEVLKDIVSKLQDAYDCGEDLHALEAECRRAMKRSQDLRTILTSDQIIKKTVFAEMSLDQREQILALSKDAEDLWQQFSRRLDQYRSTSNKPINMKRSLGWSTRGKRRAEIILERIKNVNQYAKNEIDTLMAWFTKENETTERVVESNVNAQVVGLSQSVTLRRTWRGTIQFDSRLLKDANLINPARRSNSSSPASSTLYKAVYARTRNVLVEHRYYTDYDERVKNDALQLAMFLSIDKPATMRVLPCIAIYHNDASSYGFVFDLAPLDPANTGIVDNSRVPLEAVLPTLTNLRLQLSNRTEHALFRYSRFGNDPSFIASPARYLGWDERIRFASSLAQTVYEVLLVDWVHQDIRIDNIWFTVEERAPAIVKEESGLSIKQRLPRSPYLCNFEFARPSEAYSNPKLAILSDRTLGSLNLARHPARQFGKFLVPHSKVHDIYGLGIVLLEIGLGRPIDELYHLFDKITLPDSQSASGMTAVRAPVDPVAEEKRRRIVVGALTLLPERMGSRFANLVVCCLTSNFETEENNDPENEGLDISVLRRFRRAVVEELLLLTEMSISTTGDPLLD